MVSVSGICALFLLNKAIQLTSPVVVSFIRVTDIVVSYAVQVRRLTIHVTRDT